MLKLAVVLDFEEWRGLDHREAAGRLLAAGWDVCGLGDWAVVWRSPDGSQVARVCAFEPAYGIFVALCRSLGGLSLLPRIDFDAPLSGGGRLTVMEALLPADAEHRAALTARWETAAPSDPVTLVRNEAERRNAAAAAAAPFWGGIDRNPGNVMRRASGEPVFVDLFYAQGLEIYQALLKDPAAIAAAYPAEERRFICEIAVIARESSPEEIAALRAAADQIR